MGKEAQIHTQVHGHMYTHFVHKNPGKLKTGCQ